MSDERLDALVKIERKGEEKVEFKKIGAAWPAEGGGWNVLIDGGWRIYLRAPKPRTDRPAYKRDDGPGEERPW